MIERIKYGMPKMPIWMGMLAWMLAGVHSLHAILVEVKQVSEPAGLLSSSYGGDLDSIVNTGESFTTVQPNLVMNGYVFGYWKAGEVRLADQDGRSVTRGTIVVEYAITLTAHFFPENEDSVPNSTLL